MYMFTHTTTLIGPKVCLNRSLLWLPFGFINIENLRSTCNRSLDFLLGVLFVAAFNLSSVSCGYLQLVSQSSFNFILTDTHQEL